MSSQSETLPYPRCASARFVTVFPHVPSQGSIELAREELHFLGDVGHHRVHPDLDQLLSTPESTHDRGTVGPLSHEELKKCHGSGAGRHAKGVGSSSGLHMFILSLLGIDEAGMSRSMRVKVL